MSAYFSALIHVITGKLYKTERGATAVEYGIMVALIAVVIIGVVGTIGTDLLAAFTTVAGALP